jgi:hypothetical protein
MTSPLRSFREVEGRKLGVVNHVWYDRQGRTWISVMTRSEHWYDKLQNRNPDGLTIDAEGNVWIVLIARNGIGVITADGDYIELFTDINTEGLQKWLDADERLSATPNDLVGCAGDLLKLPTSIAFGGEMENLSYLMQ